MSQNPSIEAKIVEELDSLGLLAKPGSPQPRTLQYEDLSKLTYLNMVIKACTISVQTVVRTIMIDNLLKPFGKDVVSYSASDAMRALRTDSITAVASFFSRHGVNCIAFSDALVSAGG